MFSFFFFFLFFPITNVASPNINRFSLSSSSVRISQFYSRRSSEVLLCSLCLSHTSYKMLSMAVQPNLNVSLKPLTFPSADPSFKPIKASVFTKPKSFSSNLYLARRRPKNVRLSASAATAEESVAEDTKSDSISVETPPETQVCGAERIFFLSFFCFFWSIEKYMCVCSFFFFYTEKKE